MKIHCCGCECDVDARLVSGKDIYIQRPDLYETPFWLCDTCGNYVGCHHKTTNKTKPLGVIPTTEIRKARRMIHELIDPVWQSGKVSRSVLYGIISKKIGKRFHTAEIRTIDEAREIYKIAKEIIG